MTLRDATADSVNCAFARTELAVGFHKVIDTATRWASHRRRSSPCSR